MLVVVVSAHVKEDWIEAFKSASIENSQHSLREPGVARFDVVQQADDLSRFLLIEVYKNANAPAAHKETTHYKKWKEAVDPMMATPRTKQVYDSVAPDASGWAVAQ